MKMLISNRTVPLRNGVSRLVACWNNSRFPVLFRWWQAQLKSCLPLRWQKLLDSGNEEVLVHWSAGTVSKVPEVETDSVSKVASRTILVLPSRVVLTRLIVLPDSAARDLVSVMGYELDKYMPFTSEQVYFAVDRPLHGPKNTLTAHLVVIQRETLDTILDQLVQGEYSIKAVDVQQQDGSRMRVNLLPADRRLSKVMPARQLNRFLATAALLFAVTGMWLWVSTRELQLEQMRLQVKALRTEAQQIQTLRQQLNSAREASQYVSDKKMRVLSVSGMLNELSQCIPKSTWLEQLVINAEGEVNLNGQSSQASALINEMRACTSLINPHFQGVIQGDSNTGKERFYLRAQLRHKEVVNDASPQRL